MTLTLRTANGMGQAPEMTLRVRTTSGMTDSENY